MIQNRVAPVDQLWQSRSPGGRNRRRRRSAVRRARCQPAILDHPDLGGAVAHQIGERLGKRADDRELFARVAREAFRRRARSGRGGSRDLQSIAVHDPAIDAASAAAFELQGIRRAPGLARFELAVAPGPYRSRPAAAKRVGGFASGQYSSLRLDRNVGVPRSCDRLIVGSLVVIGDDVTIMQSVTIGRNRRCRPCAPDRPRRVGQLGATILRHQHWRLREDRRRLGGRAGRAGRLYGRRRAGAADQLREAGLPV